MFVPRIRGIYAEGAPQRLGAEFANAVGTKDHARLRALLAPDVDFRALTPSRTWEASSPDEVEAIVRRWLDDDDHVHEVGRIEFATVGDRERVGYRIVGSNRNGPFVMEQQAYLASESGRIVWVRLVCSGARPTSASRDSVG